MAEHWIKSKGELQLFFCSSKQNSLAFVYCIFICEQQNCDGKGRRREWAQRLKVNIRTRPQLLIWVYTMAFLSLQLFNSLK